MDKNIFLYFMYFHVSLKRRVIFTRNNDVIFVKMSKIYKSNPLNVFFVKNDSLFLFHVFTYIFEKKVLFKKKQ